jgi:hypothetical protein
MKWATDNAPTKAVLLLAWSIALAVAGCDSLGGRSAPSNSGTLSAVAPMPRPPPRKPTPPSPGVVGRVSADGDAEQAPPPSAQQQLTGLPAPSVPPARNLDRLIGLDQSRVIAVLGSPRSQSESPPATVWHFGGTNCDLDVYFYVDQPSQVMRALRYEVRGHGASDSSARRCYEALVNARDNAEPSADPESPQ